jgi:hypothetical protein
VLKRTIPFCIYAILRSLYRMAKITEWSSFFRGGRDGKRSDLSGFFLLTSSSFLRSPADIRLISNHELTIHTSIHTVLSYPHLPKLHFSRTRLIAPTY